MKKLFLLVGVIMALASCSKRAFDEQPVEPTVTTVEVDLNNFTYEELLNKLTAATDLEHVVLKDGDSSYTVSFGALTHIGSGDEPVLMLQADGSTSSHFTDLNVSPQCIAIRHYNGDEAKAWVIYSDPEMQTAVEQCYGELNTFTKSGEPAVTPGVDGHTAMSFDLSSWGNLVATKGSGFEIPRDANIPELPETKASQYESTIEHLRAKYIPQTKASYPTISIWMIKESGANPLYHEMQWQVGDAQHSLTDVQWRVYTEYYTRSSDFRGSSDAESDLYRFRDWVRNGTYKDTDGVFMLCRWGGWGSGVLGIAFVGDYNVNYDRQGYGLSCTTCWYKCNMAHEVGHIFGAEHVPMKWYDYLYNSDLMCPQTGGPGKNWRHTDQNNRNYVYESMTQK